MNREALRNSVAQTLEGLGIQKAIVIDDQFEETNTTNWSELLTVLSDGDIETYGKFEELCDEKWTGNLEEVPSGDLLASFQRIADQSSSPKAQALAKKLQCNDELQQLTNLLEELGLKVLKMTAPPSEVPDVQLCFIDYRLRPDDPDSGGEDAAKFLKDMVESLESAIPATVLMSRKIDDSPDQQEWEEVAQKGAFLRLKYRFLDKTIIGEEIDMLLFLHGLLSTYDLGEEYTKSIKSFNEAISESVANATQALYALKPNDFHAFSNSLSTVTGQEPSHEYQEYHKSYMADHLLEVFSEVLHQELRAQSALRDVVSNFHEVLSNTVLPVEPTPVEPLHELYAKLLYERGDYIGEAICFGDIYQQGSRYWLVLTPECDLEIHNQANLHPKVKRILMVCGVPSSTPNGDSLPFPVESPWMSWDLSCPRYINHETLRSGKSYSKWGRLCVREAEKIQNSYAANLIRVGTTDIPGPTMNRCLHLWRKSGGSFQYLGSDSVLFRVPIAAKNNDSRMCLSCSAWGRLLQYAKLDDAADAFGGLNYLRIKELRTVLGKLNTGLISLSNEKQLEGDPASSRDKEKVLKAYCDSFHLTIDQPGSKWRIPVEDLLQAMNDWQTPE